MDNNKEVEFVKCLRCQSDNILDVANILVWSLETGESTDILQCGNCNRVFSVDSGDYITKEEWTLMNEEEREDFLEDMKKRRGKENKLLKTLEKIGNEGHI